MSILQVSLVLSNLKSTGRPAPGSELTDEFNVLEAGLWNAISVNKGTSVVPVIFL